MHMVEQRSNIILRASAAYELNEDGDRDMTEAELASNGLKANEDWWVLPLTGPAVKVPVKRHFLYTEKLCGDFSVFYATELDFEGEAITLAMQGTPPDVWHKPAPKSSIRKEEATRLITEQLPEDFQDEVKEIVIAEGKEGWHGFVDWCCPDESDEEERDEYDISVTQYQLPVQLSENSQATFGELEPVILETGDSFTPLVRRDIDGDGVEEIFWSGCYDYWVHEDKEFIRNTGDCCGC